MPPTIGAAIGFITSEPMPLSHRIGNQTREHHAYGHELRPETMHGAFDDGLPRCLRALAVVPLASRRSSASCR